MATTPTVVAVKESREFVKLRQLRTLHMAAFGSNKDGPTTCLPALPLSSNATAARPPRFVAECGKHITAARLFASVARMRMQIQQELTDVQATQQKTLLQLQREETQCWCSLMVSWVLLIERELRNSVESELAYFHRFAMQNEPQWRRAAFDAEQRRLASERDRRRVELQQKLLDADEDSRQDKHLFFDEARDWLTAMKFMEEDERHTVMEGVAKAHASRPNSSPATRVTCPVPDVRKPDRGAAAQQSYQQQQQQQPAYGYYSAPPQGPATRPVSAWVGGAGPPQAGIPLTTVGGSGSATMVHHPAPQNFPQYAVPRPQYGAPQHYDPSRTANYTATNGSTAYNNFGIAQYPTPGQPQQQAQQPYSGLSTYRYPTSSQYAAPPSLAHPR